MNETMNTCQLENAVEMNRVRLRIAEPWEAAIVIDFLSATNCKPCFDPNPFNERDFQAMLDRGKFLLAERHEKLLGCVFFESGSGSSYVRFLAVDKRSRQSGIGSQLLMAAEDSCQQRESQFIHIELLCQNFSNIRFWQRRGYVEFERRSRPCDCGCPLEGYQIRMAKRLLPRVVGF